MKSSRLGLIGNPENRRIVDFQKAAESLGYPKPPCLSYAALIAEPACLELFPADLLRIDSPGENESVAQALIALGGGPENPSLEHGEIAYSNEYHRGFCRLIGRVRRPCTNHPDEIALMFDKWGCHLHLTKAGVKRPPSELGPTSFSELWEKMRSEKTGRLFLKPLHGSSASGVCALRWTPHKCQLIAPLKLLRGPVLVNSLQIQHYHDLKDIRRILGLLLAQGMIVEKWIPKLTLPGGAVDLRVLVVAGQARHWVVRQSTEPMTNLHLGNARGNPDALVETIGRDRLREAFELAEKVGKSFSRSLSIGVDILLDSRHRSWVAEVNAFGDLLPNLNHRDETAYQAIVRACYEHVCTI